jgi:hypothetical protein
VSFAARVIGRLGVKVLILTNAAGGINPALTPGDADGDGRSHQPARAATRSSGPNEDAFGARFPDMSEVYSKRLRGIADDVARRQGIAIGHGVYVRAARSELRDARRDPRFRAIGADAVGMSTVPEAIVARHMGVEVLGISCITNAAAGVLPQPLNHDEVMESRGRSRRLRRAARGHHWPALTTSAGSAIAASQKDRARRRRRLGRDRRVDDRGRPEGDRRSGGAPARRAPLGGDRRNEPAGADPLDAAGGDQRDAALVAAAVDARDTRARAFSASRSAPRSKPTRRRRHRLQRRERDLRPDDVRRARRALQGALGRQGARLYAASPLSPTPRIRRRHAARAGSCSGSTAATSTSCSAEPLRGEAASCACRSFCRCPSTSGC